MIPEAWVSLGMITAGLCVLLYPCFQSYGNSSEELRRTFSGISGLSVVLLYFAVFYLTIILFTFDVIRYLNRKNKRYYVTRDFFLGN